MVNRSKPQTYMQSSWIQFLKKNISFTTSKLTIAPILRLSIIILSNHVTNTMNSTLFLKLMEVTSHTSCCGLLYKLSITIYTICPIFVVLYYGLEATQTTSEANSYCSTSSRHMCDMEWCVLKTSFFPHNFRMRFYRCKHWSPVCMISFYYCIIFLCKLLNRLSCPSYIWYAFCCRTPINIVSSFDSWTIEYVFVAVKQHPLCGKGSQGWQLRLRLEKMRGIMFVHWKQKHRSGKG